MSTLLRPKIYNNFLKIFTWSSATATFTGFVLYFNHFTSLGSLPAAFSGVKASSFALVGCPWRGTRHVIRAWKAEHITILAFALRARRLAFVVLNHQFLELVVIYPRVPDTINQKFVFPGKQDATRVLMLCSNGIVIGQFVSIFQTSSNSLTICANVPK